LRKQSDDFILPALASMINCGYCGKSNADEATQCFVCGKEFPAPMVSETPPVNSEPKLMKPEALEAGLSYESGFHRADWNYVRQWIESNVPPLDAEEAWNEAALLWVKRLCADLGGGYFVLQSRQAILLSDQPLETARWLVNYTGRVALTIKDHLGDVAWSGAFGKDVVLVFSDQDDYYQYVAHHSPDGEQATSGGVCVHSGYTHIAVPWQNENDAANAIVHELTHDCLAHLSLPLWLNEGVAVTLQKAIAPPQQGMAQSDQDAIYTAAIGWQAPIMWDELAERHFSFWTEENIQSFWAGTSFFQPGDPNELSYSLAEVFVKLLSERGNAAAFHAFVQTARGDDAGQTAALEILDADLGEGNWRPQRKALVACWESAGWQKRDNVEDAATPPGPTGVSD
jgi:hypothetical protein